MNCEDCKNTGFITLFYSTVECEKCKNKKSYSEILEDVFIKSSYNTYIRDYKNDINGNIKKILNIPKYNFSSNLLFDFRKIWISCLNSNKDYYNKDLFEIELENDIDIIIKYDDNKIIDAIIVMPYVAISYAIIDFYDEIRKFFGEEIQFSCKNFPD